MAERLAPPLTLGGNSEDEVKLASSRVVREIDYPQLLDILGLTGPLHGDEEVMMQHHRIAPAGQGLGAA